MKVFFIIAGAVLMVLVLMVLQLKSLKKHPPNAELLLSAFKMLAIKKSQENTCS
jgi:hypothetical protein